MAKQGRWAPDPEVVHDCARLGGDLEVACREQQWRSLDLVAERTGLKRNVIHSIFNGQFVRQGLLFTLVEKLDKRLWLGPKEPTGAEPATANDVLLGALAARLSSAIVQIERDCREDVVDRRLLIKSIAAFFADAKVPGSVRRIFLEPRCPSLTADDVELLSFDCGEYLQRRDAAAGGGTVCDIAIAMHQQATDWLEQAAHSPDVARALEAFSCDLGAWVGWLAFVANRFRLARHYLHKTIAEAHIAGFYQVEARAWDTMCLLHLQQGNSEKSLQAAQAGLHAAKLDTNPKLRALFHLNSARASALRGDARGFADEAVAARGLLDREPQGASAPWFRFLTTGAFSIGEGHLALRQNDQAVAEYRSIIEDPSTNYHSDVVRASVKMAQAFAFKGDFTQTAEAGMAVLPEAMTLSSQLVRSDLRQLRDYLSGQPGLPPRALEFIAAYDEVATRQA